MKKIIKKIVSQYLNENHEEYYTLYHGTSSGELNKILDKPTKLFLTTDKEVAVYYAAKGGEGPFLEREEAFKEKYGVYPDEYFDTEENGELEMFKSLYPKGEKPVVIEFKIPKSKIEDINYFSDYKGGEFTVEPSYKSNIIEVNWDDLNY